jgi:tripartite-type tricarboxylate transporter receptor subunit TctC
MTVVLGGSFVPVAVVAQDSYPSKAITIIVPTAPGGGVDLAARRVGEKMSKYLKQPVIIENRPGAGTVLGAEVMLKAPPDGYTIVAQASTLNMLPYTVKDLSFSPLKDFAPIGVMLRQTNVFSTGGKQPYNSIKDLIEAAKKSPGVLTYSHGGLGSPQHYTVELVLNATGATMQGVQYKGAGSSFVDVIADRVTLVSSGYQGQAGFFANHQLKPLAVTSAERIPPLPDVPTLKELGIDVVSQAWLGLLAHKDVPEARINKLSAALKYALDDPETREQIVKEGADPTFLTPAEFRELLTNEAKTFAELANKIGITPQ